MRMGKFLHGDPQPTTRGATIGPARAYEVVSTLSFVGQRRRVFTRMVELSGAKPGDQVLDVGCGPGYLTRLMAGAVTPGGSAHGIDASPTVIEYAKRVTAQSECTFNLGVAEALAAPDNSFDRVVSSLMIHHLPDDLRPTALREMFRVSRPGGRLLVVDFRPPKGRLGRRLLGMVGGEPAMRYNSIELLAPLAATAGFEQLSQGEIHPFLHYVQGTRPVE